MSILFLFECSFSNSFLLTLFIVVSNLPPIGPLPTLNLAGLPPLTVNSQFPTFPLAPIASNTIPSLLDQIPAPSVENGTSTVEETGSAELPATEKVTVSSTEAAVAESS